jgi:hypothetical protein
VQVVPAQEDDVDRVPMIIDVLLAKRCPRRTPESCAPAADYPSDIPASELLRTIHASHRHPL